MMNIEKAAREYVDTHIECFDSKGNPCCYPAFIAGATYALTNQWISVEERLPEEETILAVLSENFCGKQTIEVLYYYKGSGLRHPKGYYDLCGENVPTAAITHWMPIPLLSEGGKK